ncbi:hypothetical protein D3C81_814390 [compost metagenome]
MVGGHELARIVDEGNRQQRAVLPDFQLGLGVAHLAGQGGAAIVVYLLAFAVIVGNDAIRPPAAAAIEAIGILPGHIETELQGAFGVARDGPKIEALGPTTDP